MVKKGLYKKIPEKEKTEHRYTNQTIFFIKKAAQYFAYLNIKGEFDIILYFFTAPPVLSLKLDKPDSQSH